LINFYNHLELMIRISKLLRGAQFVKKIPARAGPGWDRPDVPPTERVPTNTRVTFRNNIKVHP
jgi:hypothetical protein